MPTEHLGWDDTHPDEWRLGRTCSECDAHIAARRVALYNEGPMFNIKRLQADNEGGYTQLGLARDTYDAARETGRDITAVR